MAKYDTWFSYGMDNLFDHLECYLFITQVRMCIMGATPMLRNNGTESHREAIEPKDPNDPLLKTLMTKKIKTPLTESHFILLCKICCES